MNMNSKKGEIITKLDNLLSQIFYIIYFLIIVYIAIFSLRIITTSETIQVQYTPDDGYYYLMLAKNFVRSGFWTFDMHNVTSGFHILWAYILAAIYWIGKPTDHQFILWGLILNSLIILILILFIGRESTKQKGGFLSLIIGAVLISSHNFVINTISITEWFFVILFSYLCITRWFRNDTVSKFVLFGAAFAGSLSRTDFVLLPMILFTFSIIIFYFERDRNVLIGAVVGLGGSTLGLLLVGINNFIFTGSLLQSSALIKAYWAKVHGFNFLNSILLTSDLVSFYQPASLSALAISFSICIITLFIFVKLLRVWYQNKFRELAPAMGAGVAFLGYILLYANNGAIQPWYTGNLLIPIWVLGTFALKSMNKWNELFRIAVNLVLLLIISHNIYTTVSINSNRSPWPHQQFMMEAGKYLDQTNLEGSIASWNAGIIGYYQGGTVVNIDGLVNNEVYRYIIENNLDRYLAENNIKYIIDFENMIKDPYLRRRGGYDNGQFLAKLHPLKIFDDGQYSWSYLTLYQLSP